MYRTVKMGEKIYAKEFPDDDLEDELGVIAEFVTAGEPVLLVDDLAEAEMIWDVKRGSIEITE